MSIAVRTLMTPERAEDDRFIGWYDRPILGDIVHEEGTRFEVTDGRLIVHKDGAGDRPIAVYSPGNWIFARIEKDES
jgi:hypothetical protein